MPVRVIVIVYVCVIMCVCVIPTECKHEDKHDPNGEDSASLGLCDYRILAWKIVS